MNATASAVRPARWQHWRGDLSGALVSGLVAVPLAIAYGMFAFVSLGDQYFAQGVLAGLYTSLVVGLVCVALGERSTTLYAPRVVTTFFIGTIIVHSLTSSPSALLRGGNVELTLAVIFSIVLLGGVFQALFGWLRLGSVIRHTPHPVLAGFQNAAALLLVLAQAGTVLGFDQHVPLARVPQHIDSAHWLALVVAAAAGLAMWHAKRLLPKVPPALVGLAAGTLVHYLLGAAGLGAALGPVIGPMPAAEVSPANLPAFADLAQAPGLRELLPTMLGAALCLALIASVDALLCARLLEGPTGYRPQGNVQLVRLGLGNIVAACFGGITSGLNLGPSIVNRTFGARTAMSVLVVAIVIGASLYLALPAIGYLPRAALSGIVVVIGIQHLDPWTLRVLRGLLRGHVGRRGAVTAELLVVIIIAAASILANIVIAVLLGVALSILFFVMRVSRSVVRSTFRCEVARSSRTRTPELMDALGQAGHRILVLELEGPIFFGTAEKLRSEIEREVESPTASVVLDFRRVTELDSTGTRVLLQIQEDLARRGHPLLASGVGPGSPLWHAMRDGGLVSALTRERLFPDLDHALEWAEDDLLRSLGNGAGINEEFPLEHIDVLRGMAPHEISTLRHMLRRIEFSDGDTVFREGDAGTDLYIVTHGTASARIRLGPERDTRLNTFGPGTVFGEVALLDQSLRSATVTADDRLVCYRLGRTDFVALTRQYPSIASRLLVNVARELAYRLRRVNRIIHHLER